MAWETTRAEAPSSRSEPSSGFENPLPRTQVRGYTAELQRMGRERAITYHEHRTKKCRNSRPSPKGWELPYGPEGPPTYLPGSFHRWFAAGKGVSGWLPALTANHRLFMLLQYCEQRGWSVTATILAWILGISAVILVAQRLRLRLQLSGAKHRSLAGHARMGRRFARLVPFYEYDEAEFFRADDAPEAIANQRRTAFARLSALYAERFANTIRKTQEVEGEISDLQFTGRYRVPFQFSRYVRQHLSSGSFAASSEGPTTTDLDGNQRYDLTGSYGVNVFGYDFYKQCIERGSARVRGLGPVLGAYHPVVAENVHRLREISGQDEISFHMSGTEAVMQAVRLARYHTGRRYLVRFCGAYHGWWGEVQPGVGNPVTEHDTLTLKDMDEQSLRVLRSRRDIACVLVNPLQCPAPQRRRAGGFYTGRRRLQRNPGRPLRPRSLYRVAAAPAPGVF